MDDRSKQTSKQKHQAMYLRGYEIFLIIAKQVTEGL